VVGSERQKRFVAYVAEKLLGPRFLRLRIHSAIIVLAPLQLAGGALRQQR